MEVVTELKPAQEYEFDVFISYSRRDTAFASKLEKALEGFKPPRIPGLPDRNLRVFRDENDLFGADYFESIDYFINASENMIVVCSPNSSKSEYVNDEIRRFNENHPSRNIIPIIIDGIPNNEVTEGQESQKAFPEELYSSLDMPLAINYIDINLRFDSIKRGTYSGSWYQILSNIYKTPRSVIEQRERKRQLRRLQLISLGTIMLMTLLFGLAVYASFQKNRAERSMKIAERNLQESNYTLAQLFEEKSSQVESEDPQKAFLYTLGALAQDIGENRTLPISQRLLARQGIDAGIDAQLWASPRPLDGINDVLFSPDSLLMATVSRDGQLRLWNMETGEESIALGIPGDAEVQEIAFSPDGRMVAGSTDENNIHLWRIDTHEWLARLEGHKGTIHDICFDPGGRFLASASADSSIRFWNIKTYTKRFVFRSNKAEGQHALAISPDGSVLAAGTASGLITFWDMALQHQVGEMEAHSQPVSAMHFSPDGSVLASTSGDSSLLLIDIGPNQSAHKFVHEGAEVLDLSFHPDSRRLACGMSDNSIRLYDVKEKAPLHQVVGHNGPVTGVSYTYDGKWIISGSLDQRLRLWDSETGEELAKLDGHTRNVNAVVFSPTELLVASGSNDGNVRLWDAETGEEVNTIYGHKEKIYDIAFSADGRYIASASRDGTVRVWDAEAGVNIQTLEGHQGLVRSVTFNPISENLELVSSSSAGQIFQWNVSTGKIIKRYVGHSTDVWRVAFSPDGTTLASAGKDRDVVLWNTRTALESRRLELHRGKVWGLAFSKDGRKLATSGQKGDMFVWDIATEAATPLVGHEGDIWSVSFSPDAKKLASAGNDYKIRIWDVDTGSQLSLLAGHADTVWTVAYSQGGNRLVSGSSDRSIRLWDVETIDRVKVLSGGIGSIQFVRFHPSADLLLTTAYENSVRMWEVNSGSEILDGIPVDSSVNGLDIHPNGEIAALGLHGGQLLIYNFLSGTIDTTISLARINFRNVGALSFSKDGEAIALVDNNRVAIVNSDDLSIRVTFRPHLSIIRAIAFDHTGEILATAASDNTVALWNSQNGERIATLRGHTGDVYDVKFHPINPEILASASRDGTVRLWRIDKGRVQLESTILAHNDVVHALDFSPDGLLLASGSFDTTVKLWDVANGKEVAVLEGHQSRIRTLNFNPNGLFLASGGDDRNIRLWNVGQYTRYQSVQKDQESMKTIFNAFMHLLPYQLEGFTIVEKPRKYHMTSSPGFNFQRVGKYKRLQQPRPLNTDPLDWAAESTAWSDSVNQQAR